MNEDTYVAAVNKSNRNTDRMSTHGTKIIVAMKPVRRNVEFLHHKAKIGNVGRAKALVSFQKFAKDV